MVTWEPPPGWDSSHSVAWPHGAPGGGQPCGVGLEGHPILTLSCRAEGLSGSKGGPGFPGAELNQRPQLLLSPGGLGQLSLPGLN